MSQQPADPAASLLSAAKCNECRIGIAHDLHRNGLTGREKRNHIRLFMLCKITQHLFKACFGRSTHCYGQERFVKASGLDPRNADFGKQSQETHLISIAGKAGRERVHNP